MSQSPLPDRLTLKIGLTNDAFRGDNGRRELGKLLREVATTIECGGNYDVIMDANGNSVGQFIIV